MCDFQERNRILEKQGHLVIYARTWKNLTHRQPILVFKDSSYLTAPKVKPLTSCF
jgi:hypothetical protein